MIDLLALAQQCAPQIPPAVIAAISHKESRHNPYAIGHPSYPAKKQPQSLNDAITAANALAQNGQRYDAGLMQISSANFSWLGLDNTTAFDPCRSMAAAQQVILHGIQADGANATTFFNTVSRYNTGNATRGYTNGYVADVAVQLLNPQPAIMQSPQTTLPAAAVVPEKPQSGWKKIGNTQGLFSRADNDKVALHSATAQNTDLFQPKEDDAIYNTNPTMQNPGNNTPQDTKTVYAIHAHRITAGDE